MPRMKPTPHDWPRISSALFYQDPRAAIDWLCRAFGFEVRLVVDDDDGAVRHSELVYGGGVVMVAGESREKRHASPRSVDGRNTQTLFMYVEDVEAHCARARAAGAKILTEIRLADYGEGYWANRSYEAEDPEGHRFWFSERVRG